MEVQGRIEEEIFFMLILGVKSNIGNPKLISISSLLAFLPPSFKPLSSSPMFSKWDGDSATKLVVCSYVVVGTTSGSNCKSQVSLAPSRNLWMSLGTTNWLFAVVNVYSFLLFTVVSDCEFIKLGRLVSSPWRLPANPLP